MKGLHWGRRGRRGIKRDLKKREGFGMIVAQVGCTCPVALLS
jgi:hypothetical protein